MTSAYERITSWLFLLMLRVWGWFARKPSKTTITLSDDLYAFEVGDTFAWPAESEAPKNRPDPLVVVHVDRESRTITLAGGSIVKNGGRK